MIDHCVVLDLETTGLDPKKDKMIEIGALKIVNGEITQVYSTFVNPGLKLSPKIMELTNISQKDVDKAPSITEVIEYVIEFIGEEPLLGHHIIFDYSFLKKAAANQKLIFEKMGLDTLTMARLLLPEVPSKNLGYLCEYFQIPHNAHRALEDAKATWQLYRKLMQVRSTVTLEEALFLPKALIYKVKKESPITNRQKERLLELIEKHHLQVEYQVEMLTKNEASRYTDIILATYGR